jgi:N-acetyltransferase 10
VDHQLIADLTPTLAALALGPAPRLAAHLTVAQQAILLELGLRRATVDEAATALRLPPSQLLALFAKAVRKLTTGLAAVLEAEAAATLPRAGASAKAAARLRPIDAQPLGAELREGGARALAGMRNRAAATDAAAAAAADDDAPPAADGASAAAAAAALVASGELARYAIRGTDDDWTEALKGSAGAKGVRVKGGGGGGGDDEDDDERKRHKAAKKERRGSEGGEGGKAKKAKGGGGKRH